MSWIQSLQHNLLPLFGVEPAPETRLAHVARPEQPSPSKPQKSNTKVTSSAGVRVSSGGKRVATGGVKVKSGPSTTSASLQLDEKGRMLGRVGQGFELRLGEHRLLLGASVDSKGEVKSQVSFKSPLFKND